MRRLNSKSVSGPSPCDLESPCPPYRTAGMATLISLCIFISVLSACSEEPASVPDIPRLANPTPTSRPAPVVAPSPVPTGTPFLQITSRPTPDPTKVPNPSTIILQIFVAEPNQGTSYDRDEWKHWIDDDGDCQSTRHEVLISESTEAVDFKDERECEVGAGNWRDPYTGDVLTDPGDLDIDHMVPLINAHRSGGHSWNRERKSEYANNLSYDGHLIAVSASANRSKGGKGPDEWRPQNREYWCQYALDWVSIKWEWKLTATEEESDALADMLLTCDTRIFLQTIKRHDAAPSETSASVSATPMPTPILVEPAHSSTPTEIAVLDRNCSDFETWSEAQTFFESEGGPVSDPYRLDSDGDGIACQSLPGAPVRGPDPTQTPLPVNLPKPLPDHNCSDFGTWSEAQAFYEAQGGPGLDPHGLDRDRDGIACQSLPGAPGSALPSETKDAEISPLVMRCSDFHTWEDVQEFFVLHGGPGSDPFGLDVDGNGIPCQSIYGAPAIPALLEIPVDDLDCSDFDTWSAAQEFYEEQGGPDADPHNLDRDGDGTACQSLPGYRDSEDDSLEDRNCSDFPTWSEAQEFYESEGGPGKDPHRLDRDGDGVACQSLPGAPGSGTSSRQSVSKASTPTPMPEDTYNCSDFATWSEAQSFYESEGGPSSDPHRLDRDGDGVACQSLPGAPGGKVTSERSASVAPTPTPKSKDTHNCSDFATWSEAQSFYESEGGPESDPHRLDRDGDGVACQSLPGAPGGKVTSERSASVAPTPTPKPRDTHNCSDFATWSEAQSFYESEGGPGSDPHRLDRDGDGVACQSLPGAPGSGTSSDRPASAAPTPTPKPKDTHNCSDFETWSEAQEFFESEGGPGSDPHRLDGNGDGIACESLPGAPGKSTPVATALPTQTPTAVPTTTTESGSFRDRNCSDFSTWLEAQSFFESEGGPGSDPHRLDRDKDGIACESLPGAPKPPTPTPTPASG